MGLADGFLKWSCFMMLPLAIYECSRHSMLLPTLDVIILFKVKYSSGWERFFVVIICICWCWELFHMLIGHLYFFYRSVPLSLLPRFLKFVNYLWFFLLIARIIPRASCLLARALPRAVFPSPKLGGNTFLWLFTGVLMFSEWKAFVKMHVTSVCLNLLCAGLSSSFWELTSGSCVCSATDLYSAHARPSSSFSFWDGISLSCSGKPLNLSSFCLSLPSF